MGVDLESKLVRMENGTPLAFRSNFSWLVVYGWNSRLGNSLGVGLENMDCSTYFTGYVQRR